MFIGKTPGGGCGIARQAEGATVLLCLSGEREENLREKMVDLRKNGHLLREDMFFI